MDYGLKIEARKPVPAAVARRMGDLPHFLAGLRDCGLSFVEVAVGDEPDAEALTELVHVCRDAGMFVSMHPYLQRLGPEAFGREGVAEGIRRILALGDGFGDITGRPVSIVFHGGLANAEPHHVGLPEAMAGGRAFFRWAGAQVGESFPNVRVFCETQLPAQAEDEFTRVGDTYDDCLALVDGADVGLCWDFGHAFRSAIIGKHPDFPPDAFLRRVGHVHAHDTVARPGQPFCTADHEPLGTGICPWREYAGLLARAGFRGRILFELALFRFSSFDALTESLRYSVEGFDRAFS